MSYSCYCSEWSINIESLPSNVLIRRYGIGNVYLNSFHGLTTLKIRSSWPKFCASLFKSIHLCRRYRRGKANFDSLQAGDLENRSRSPNSKQLFFPSQTCIYASLMKFHPMVQKISCRKEATRTLTPTESAPKTMCPPPSVGGNGT